MVRLVSRGIIGVELAGQRKLKPMDSEQVSFNAHAVIVAEQADAYQLKDRRDLMRRLVRGSADIHGRRLFTDPARMDARYVIKRINQRLRGEALTERQSVLLLGSLRRVYESLEEGLSAEWCQPP